MEPFAEMHPCVQVLVSTSVISVVPQCVAVPHADELHNRDRARSASAQCDDVLCSWRINWGMSSSTAAALVARA